MTAGTHPAWTLSIRQPRDLGACRVIAPTGPYSGCGHRVTTHGPITVSRPAAGRIAVSGTPADCVRLALHHLAPDAKWVLSGINTGGNLGIGRASFRHCGGGARGRLARSARDRAVAVHRPRTSGRLGPHGQVGATMSFAA